MNPKYRLRNLTMNDDSIPDAIDSLHKLSHWFSGQLICQCVDWLHLFIFWIYINLIVRLSFSRRHMSLSINKSEQSFIQRCTSLTNIWDYSNDYYYSIFSNCHGNWSYPLLHVAWINDSHLHHQYISMYLNGFEKRILRDNSYGL